MIIFCSYKEVNQAFQLKFRQKNTGENFVDFDSKFDRKNCHNIVFQDDRRFLQKIGQKSPKMVIVTLTPEDATILKQKKTFFSSRQKRTHSPNNKKKVLRSTLD
jgi:hypothetical protein